MHPCFPGLLKPLRKRYKDKDMKITTYWCCFYNKHLRITMAKTSRYLISQWSNDMSLHECLSAEMWGDLNYQHILHKTSINIEQNRSFSHLLMLMLRNVIEQVKFLFVSPYNRDIWCPPTINRETARRVDGCSWQQGWDWLHCGQVLPVVVCTALWGWAG